MDNSLFQKNTNDSEEAIEALENGLRILAKMIVKAVTAELVAQERIYSQAGINSTTVTSPKVNTTDQQEKSLVLSVAEASKLLGISKGTVYTLVHTKQIPYIKYGKRIVIPRLALLKMLEEAGTFKPATSSTR